MAKVMGESEILTIKEIAAYLKVTERTIYRLSQAKTLPCFKVGGMWRFLRADIDHWIRHQTVNQSALVRKNEMAKSRNTRKLEGK